MPTLNTVNLNEAISSLDNSRVEDLISQGVDMDCAGPRFDEDDEFVSPLNHALYLGNMGAFKALLKAGAGVNHGEPTPPVMVATGANNLEALMLLREHGAWLMEDHLGQDGGTLMHMAATAGASEIITWLAGQGLEPDAYDLLGLTPLLCALSGEITPMHAEAAAALIAAGAEAGKSSLMGSTPDNALVTPLEYAVKRGDGDLVKMLIEAGAPLHPQRNDQTPTNTVLLIDAMTRRPGDPAVVKALIDAGANTSMRGSLNLKTGQFYPHGNIGAPDYARSTGSQDIGLMGLAATQIDPDMVLILHQHGLSVNDVDPNGRTPIHLLLEHSREFVHPWMADTLNMFLECGANPNAVDDEGNTALHLLAMRYNLVIKDEAITMKMVQMIWDAGADPSLCNATGMTALDIMLTGSPETGPGPRLLTAAMEQQDLLRNTPDTPPDSRRMRL